jgi:hypothetical protein
VPPATVIRAEHSLVVGCSRDNVISMDRLPKQKSCDEIVCLAGVVGKLRIEIGLR